MSFDLERDKCLKILLMFFSASRAKGKKNKKYKEWEIKQTTWLYTYEHLKKNKL